jgi:hypothetical protein
VTDYATGVCPFCGEPVNPIDRDAWRQVTVWVGGPKAQGACLQGKNPLAFAHALCIKLAKSRAGSVRQGSML